MSNPALKAEVLASITDADMASLAPSRAEPVIDTPVEQAASVAAEVSEAQDTTQVQTTEAQKPTEPTKFDKKGFDRLVKEKKDARENEKALKQYERVSKVLSESQIEALERARLSNNPLDAMQALGYTYAQIAQQMVQTQKAPEPKSKKDTKTEFELPAEVQEKLKLVDELMAERKQTQAANQRNEIMGAIKKAVTPDKYRHIAALGDFDGVEAVIKEIYQQHGGFPTDNAQEIIEIAAEEYERRLEDMAKVFAPIYGNVNTVSASSNGSSSREQNGTSSVGSRESLSGRNKSLNNNMVAPTKAATNKPSREQLKADILNDNSLIWPE